MEGVKKSIHLTPFSLNADQLLIASSHYVRKSIKVRNNFYALAMGFPFKVHYLTSTKKKTFILGRQTDTKGLQGINEI